MTQCCDKMHEKGNLRKVFFSLQLEEALRKHGGRDVGELVTLYLLSRSREMNAGD